MELVFNKVHKKLHCGLGPQMYVNGINLAGFCATGITEFVQEKINVCHTCTEAKMVIKGVSTLTQNMKCFYGPDDYVMNTTHPNLMKIVKLTKQDLSSSRMGMEATTTHTSSPVWSSSLTNVISFPFLVLTHSTL